jgi:hypothetical protein
MLPGPLEVDCVPSGCSASFQKLSGSGRKPYEGFEQLVEGRVPRQPEKVGKGIAPRREIWSSEVVLQ